LQTSIHPLKDRYCREYLFNAPLYWRIDRRRRQGRRRIEEEG